MDKILALYNIKTVRYVTNDGVERKYAYTSKMLGQDIFIEYFFEGTTEESEEIDNEDLDDIEEESEYGSRLSVIMKHKNKYYEFLMYHDALEIGVPIMLLQTIIFLAKLIDETETSRLVEYLTSVATDPLIPHTLSDKEHRDVSNKLIKLKLQTVHELIQEGKANLN